ncbi:HlyD family secretion protein [Anianabacter salinae]|uniref:HlyD family secretion protein n=1 Tax=Anianabacter salinae TaxID=2851023 RepID=UPI00225E41CF|nr:HlyD family efflux transporter periplasmic adaptor subunit [Anianabacter salinae]MBV0912364.1 HlyD family secretion protein [Anianabacter salinae]
MTSAEPAARGPLRLGLLATALLVLGAALFGALVPLSTAVVLPARAETARPAAELLPDAPGRIARVLVANGDSVRAGDVLIRLDAGGLTARRASALAEIDALSARLARIAAEARGTAPPDVPGSAAATHEATLLSARITARDTMRAALVARTETLERQRTALAAEDRALAAERTLLRGELARQARLAAQGLALDERRAGLEVALARSDGSAAALHARRADLAATENALRTEQAQLDDRLAEELAEQTAALTPALAAARAALAEIDRQRAALILRAPVSGTIDALSAAPGDLAHPGAALLRIVPNGPVLIAAALPPQQREGLDVGGPVRIRVDASAGPAPTLTGRIRWISPDVQPMAAGAPPAYRIEAHVDQGALAPGQPVTLVAPTGHATALALLLSPITSALARAAPD